MPLDRNDFAKAQLPLEGRILSFLQEHPDKAYTMMEVYAGVENVPLTTVQMEFLLTSADGTETRTLRRFADTLEALIQSGRIESAEVRGSVYYALRQA